METEYTDKETFFDSNNEERTAYNIFTKYKISVTENIKNDDLLEEGTEYIFSVSRCDDAYKACGENTSIEITASNEVRNKN